MFQWPLVEHVEADVTGWLHGIMEKRRKDGLTWNEMCVYPYLETPQNAFFCALFLYVSVAANLCDCIQQLWVYRLTR